MSVATAIARKSPNLAPCVLINDLLIQDPAYMAHLANGGTNCYSLGTSANRISGILYIGTLDYTTIGQEHRGSDSEV